MLTELDKKEITNILIGEYYSIGIESGHEAIGNLLSDYHAGNFVDTFVEWGMSEDEFRNEIFWMVSEWIYSEGAMFVSQEKFIRKG